MFVHQVETVEQALALAAAGRTAGQISREIGVPQRTVSNWLKGAIPRRSPPRYPALSYEELIGCRRAAYAYVLGLYLGDGHIARMPRTYSLRITLDSAYPGIIDAAAAAIDKLLPDCHAGKYPHATATMVTVVSYSRHWPRLIPQYGSGYKHLRRIELFDWQQKITDAEAREFIRGLIHSDGCRYVARQRRARRYYDYARYGFSNRSEGILALFCRHLDRLQVPWTRPTSDTIQIARRDGVAKLDEFVGPKR